MTELGVEPSVDLIEVRDEHAAAALGFVGSPTVRVNGVDIAEDDVKLLEPSTSCRIYVDEAPGVRSGVPPREMIRRAFERADR